MTKADTAVRRRVEDQQLIHQLRTRKEQIANFEELYLKQQRVIEKLERLVNTQNSRGELRLFVEHFALFKIFHTTSQSIVKVTSIFRL